MIERTYMVLYSAKEGGDPEHLVTVRGAINLRCHCNTGIKVFRDRIRNEVSPRVSCQVCQEEIDRWEQFWSRQDERMRR